MKMIIAVLAILPMFASLAQADSATTKRDFYNLAREVQDASVDTRASDTNLTAARTQLQNALNLIRSSGGPGGPMSDACVKFAYEKYYINLNGSEAMNKAGAACRKTDDLEVMKFLYEKHYLNQNAVNSMDNAAEGSKAPMAGKLEIVKFAYEKYYVNNNGTVSAAKAAEGARKVAIGSDECLKTAYTNYYRSQNSSTAMDSAFTFCAN